MKTKTAQRGSHPRSRKRSRLADPAAARMTERSTVATYPLLVPCWTFWLYLNYMNAIRVPGWTWFDARAAAIVLLGVDGTDWRLRWKGEPFSAC